MFRFALLVIMVGCLVLPARADETQRAFDDLFGAKLAAALKSADRADDLALAKQMLDLGKKAGVDPGLMGLLLEQASELSQRHPDGYPMAIEALTLLADAQPQRSAEVQETIADLLTRQLARLRGEEQQHAGEKLVELLIAMSEAKAQADDFANAAALSRRALAAAARIKSTNTDAAKAQLDSVLHRHRLKKEIAIYEQRLLKRRNDHAAAEALVLLFVIDLDQPAKAQPYLSAVDDEAMKKHVPLTTKDASQCSADETLALGEWFRDVGAKLTEPGKSIALYHAATRFDRYLKHGDATSLGKTKAIALSSDVKKHLEKTGYQHRITSGSGGTTQRPPSTSTNAINTHGLRLKDALVVYSFEKGTIRKKGTTVYVQDLSGNNLHGELFGAEVVNGQVGDALSFDGKDDFVKCERLYEQLIRGHDAITIATWVLPKRGQSTGYLFSVGSQGDRGIAVIAHIEDRWRFSLPTDAQGHYLPSIAQYGRDWQHAVFQWADNKQRIFIDGKLDKELPVPPFKMTRNVLGAANLTGHNEDCLIARIGSQAKVFKREERHFAGLLDEFAIFTRALSDVEIKQLYEQGKAGRGLGEK